ncbi:hypothetical protein K461DRAFT_80479 [Myriangium duriaei CBS 260.36]|uniref:Uncharacterized protein n=1 Tax=Myriangium duriaei CBS 260.36 TaxID=1168546 RepID=A0A9P4JBD5_9PEZI|nr:hypothetical protein K461DRAFT_80479 [Myriangium duriaei CBS 260.36]
MPFSPSSTSENSSNSPLSQTNSTTLKMSSQDSALSCGPAPYKDPVVEPKKKKVVRLEPRYKLRNTPARQRRRDAVAAPKKKEPARRPGKVQKRRGPGRPKKRAVSPSPPRTPKRRAHVRPRPVKSKTHVVEAEDEPSSADSAEKVMVFKFPQPCPRKPEEPIVVVEEDEDDYEPPELVEMFGVGPPRGKVWRSPGLEKEKAVAKPKKKDAK